MRCSVKILCVALLLLLTGGSAYGAELTNVMNAYTTEESITIFLKNEGQQVNQVYIGNESCDDFTVSENSSVRTIVLLDNSQSIKEEYRDNIKAFLTDLVAARKDGDTFTIATFAEDITYLAQDSNDYLDIKNKIENISFEDQESYFTKTLYDVLDELQKNDEVQYTRVIVIADGAENESLGYTDEELHEKIQSARIPVYTIGCLSEGNEENLKEMFAISRISNGKDYLLDETGIAEILQDITEDTDILRADITPPDEICDGTVRTVRLVFGDDYCTVELTMPFKASAEEAAPVSESAAAEGNTDETMTISDQEENLSVPDLPEIQIPIFLLIAVAVAGAAAAVIIIFIRRRKNQKEYRAEEEDTRWKEPPGKEGSRGAGRKTEIYGEENGGGKNSGRKTDYFGEPKTVRLCLQDTHDPSKTFEYPIRDRVRIGYDENRCQIVLHYRYVSSVHCEVIKKDKGYIVRDGGDTVVASTNGTFVNEKRATPELPLPSGAVLRLGAASFRVTFK